MSDNNLNASDTQLLMFLLGAFLQDYDKLQLLPPKERVIVRKSVSTALKKMRNKEKRFSAREIIAICFVVDSEIERAESVFSGSLSSSDESELNFLSSLHRISKSFSAVRDTLEIIPD